MFRTEEVRTAGAEANHAVHERAIDHAVILSSLRLLLRKLFFHHGVQLAQLGRGEGRAGVGLLLDLEQRSDRRLVEDGVDLGAG